MLSLFGRPSSRNPPIRAKIPQEGTMRNRRLLSQPAHRIGHRNPEMMRMDVTPEAAATTIDLLILAASIPAAISETPNSNAAWNGTSDVRYVAPENHAVRGNHAVTTEVTNAPKIAIQGRSCLFNLSSL